MIPPKIQRQECVSEIMRRPWEQKDKQPLKTERPDYSQGIGS